MVRLLLYLPVFTSSKVSFLNFFEFHFFLEACLHFETRSSTWLVLFTSVYLKLDLLRLLQPRALL